MSAEPVDAAASPPPLVLIAGRMTTSVAWTYQDRAFSEDREVITPDWHFRLATIKDMAEAIAERLPERFDLVGWSMGGYITLELYPLVKDRVRRLVLVSTTARSEAAESAAARLELLAEAEENGMQRAWAKKQLMLARGVAPVDPELTAQLADGYLELGLETMRSQTHAIIGRADARDRLKDIACPLLVVTGENDNVIPVEHSAEIAASVQGSEFHVIPAAGHCAPYETPEAFNAVMRRFLG
jgi:pimeloyl-ACP methyl ester carboxylesterase